MTIELAPAPVDPLAGYRVLTMPDLEALRRERVQALEADHFRTRLLLAEAGNDPAAATKLHGQLGELERRIGVHCDPVELDLELDTAAGNPAADQASNDTVTTREADGG